MIGSPPDDGVTVRVDLAFSSDAQRAAFAAGHVPVSERSVWITPRDPNWDAFCRLAPTIAGEYEQQIVLTSRADVRLEHGAPSSTRWHEGRELEVAIRSWPQPTLTVTRQEAPDELTTWPTSSSEVLALVETAEQEVRAEVERHLADLLVATLSWFDDLDARVAAWSDRVHAWKADGLLYDEDRFWGGFLDNELDELTELLGRLRGLEQPDLRMIDLTEGERTRDVVRLVVPPVLREAHRRVEELMPIALAGESRAFKMRTASKEQQSALEEATAWIADHGSPRLKKTVEAGLLEGSLAVYRDERLANDHPDWLWLARADEKAVRDPINPSEEALDSLLLARESVDPKASLRFHTDAQQVLVVASILGRTAWRPAEGLEAYGRFARNLERDELRAVRVVNVYRSPSWELNEEPF
jgi:hypothetical protein